MPHIQITEAPPSKSYTVTTASTGPYTIPFAFFEADGSDLAVYIDGDLVQPSDYTVTPTSGFTGGYPSGSLTFASTIEDCALTIERDMNYERTTDFPNSGPLDMTALNTELDKNVARQQQLANRLDRVVEVQPGQTINPVDVDALDGKMLIMSGGTIIGQAIASPLSNPAEVTHYVHAQDFGAVGDGVTDDTTALNLALAYIRSETTSIFVRKVVLTGGPHVYRVNGSLNATSIAGTLNWGIQQLIIDAHCSDKVVLDLTDSRFGVFRDIYIWGDETDQPYTGLQHCRRASDQRAAGTHHFENVNVLGYFTNAALHNQASEVCHYDKCKFWNYRDEDVNGEAWAAIFDGEAEKTPISDFVAPDTAAMPFNLTRLTSCEIRKNGSTGPAIYLSRFRRWTAEDCYFVANDSSYFEIFLTGSERDFTCRGHFEGVTTPPELVKFTGAAAARNMEGFILHDQSSTCTTSVIACDGPTEIRLLGLDLKITAYDVTPSVGVFDDPTKYKVVGHIVAPAGSMNSIATFATFIGTVRDSLSTTQSLTILPTFTVATLPTAATYPRALVYVSNGTSNKRLAVSDGTNWRFPDGNIVS